MNAEKQRIVVAEFCGFKEYHEKGGTSKHPQLDWGGYSPDGEFVLFQDLPDYPNDLNAMHEAEKVLSDQQCFDFLNHLGKIAQTSFSPEWLRRFQVLHATAVQRCEAMVRTIGKWED